MVERSYKVIEQGNGFDGVEVGAELYDAKRGELLVVTQIASSIHTDYPRGNYIHARCRLADRDVTSLTDEEFAAIPVVGLAIRWDSYASARR